jgi:hypothetical protein
LETDAQSGDAPIDRSECDAITVVRPEMHLTALRLTKTTEVKLCLARPMSGPRYYGFGWPSGLCKKGFSKKWI